MVCESRCLSPGFVQFSVELSIEPAHAFSFGQCLVAFVGHGLHGRGLGGQLVSQPGHVFHGHIGFFASSLQFCIKQRLGLFELCDLAGQLFLVALQFGDVGFEDIDELVAFRDLGVHLFLEFLLLGHELFGAIHGREEIFVGSAEFRLGLFQVGLKLGDFLFAVFFDLKDADGFLQRCYFAR